MHRAVEIASWMVSGKDRLLNHRTGHYLEREGDRYYAQQRYYQPSLGRFNRIDPWEGNPCNPITLKKYLYGNGNPLYYTDPTGMCGGPAPADFSDCAFAAATVNGDSPELFERDLALLTQAELDASEAAVNLGKGVALAGLESLIDTAMLASNIGRMRYDTNAAREVGRAVDAVTDAVAHPRQTWEAVGTAVGESLDEQHRRMVSGDTAGAWEVRGRLAAPFVYALAPLAPRKSLLSPSAATNRVVQQARVLEQQGAHAVVMEGASGEAVGRMPSWLRERFREGSDFNRRQAEKYPYNEVYVESTCEGGACLRLDSYDPDVGAIVSRKHTQLAAISPQTASNYLRELERKYPPGAVIADVPSNRNPSNAQPAIAGQRLRGQMYLEVPKQNAPVPPSIIDEATQRRIIIRDELGNEY